MGGTADPRVRLRVFNYLRISGIDVRTSNTVASKVVGSMAGSGKLPFSVVSIAAAAVTSNPQLDRMDEKSSYSLLEPKAEPFETGPLSKEWGQGTPQMRTRSPSLSRKSSFGRTPSPTLKGPVGGMGTTNFAIIEPILYRREVQALVGSSLSRSQLQCAVGDVSETVRA